MFKNQKLAVRIGLIVSATLIICFAVLGTILHRSNSKIVTDMLTNEMNDVVQSREVIINNYVASAEEYLQAFAKSDEIRNVLTNPENEDYVKRAQEYTDEYAAVKGIFEGLYVADTETNVYVHTNRSAIGIPTREGDSLKQLQDTMMTKDEIFNCGILQSPSSGNMVMSMYYPLFDANNVCLGYVGAAVYAKNLMDSLLSISIKGMPDAEYVFINADTSTYLYNKDDALINSEIKDETYLKIIGDVTANPAIDTGLEDSKTDDIESIIVYKYIPDRKWIFMVRDTKDNIYSTLNMLNNTTIAASAIVAVLNILVLVVVLGGVGRKLKVVQKGIKKLGRMDLTIDNDVKQLGSRKDEIGLICSTLDRTSGNLRGYISEIDKQLAAMSDGDFTITSEIKYEGAFETINDSLVHIQSALRKSFKEIATAAAQLSVDSQNVAQGAASLADASYSERNLALDIENNLNEIEVTVAASTDNAISAKAETAKAGEMVNNSKDKMDALMAAMQKIANAANQIVEINNSMERIARQTHLLAMNASVEAARAGETGRGFSVVANEIRDLAEQSNEAAAKAFEQIEQTLAAVKLGTELASQTSEYLYEVVNETNTINNAVSEITDASMQEKDKLTGISGKLREIGHVVDITASTADESAVSSKKLDSQVKVLQKNLNRYKV